MLQYNYKKWMEPGQRSDYKNNICFNREKMKVHKNSLISQMGHGDRSTNKLSLKAITRDNLPYFWGWIAVSIWLYAYFIPIGGFAVKVSLLRQSLEIPRFTFISC